MVSATTTRASQYNTRTKESLVGAGMEFRINVLSVRVSFRLLLALLAHCNVICINNHIPENCFRPLHPFPPFTDAVVTVSR